MIHRCLKLLWEGSEVLQGISSAREDHFLIEKSVSKYIFLKRIFAYEIPSAMLTVLSIKCAKQILAAMLVNCYIEKTLACTKMVRDFGEVLELSLSRFLFTVFIVFCCPNGESSMLLTQSLMMSPTI